MTGDNVATVALNFWIRDVYIAANPISPMPSMVSMPAVCICVHMNVLPAPFGISQHSGNGGERWIIDVGDTLQKFSLNLIVDVEATNQVPRALLVAIRI
jgi:hypothetical protein